MWPRGAEGATRKGLRGLRGVRMLRGLSALRGVKASRIQASGHRGLGFLISAGFRV